MNDILDQVDPETRETLLRFGFDAERFALSQAEVASGRLSPESNRLTGRVEPPPEDALHRMPLPDDAGFDSTYHDGMAAIGRSEVAIAVLNGGMATRFGGVVKGTVEAVDGKSFLEWKLEEARRVARAAGGEIPCAIMNSFATDAKTRAFLDGLQRRSENLPEPLFFNQFVSLRMNPDGSLFRENDGSVSLYGPGHGDFPEALRQSGTLETLRRRGVRYLMLSNVDNLGARVDPVVVGTHLAGGRAMTVEVTAKEPDDAGGAPALVDGRLMHVEGFRYPPGFDQGSIRVFNCNSFVFNLEALDHDYPLTWFYVQKTVEGRPAVQLERLVNELTSFIPASFLEVPRTGPRGRFFPIKEPDDLVESRPTLHEMLSASLTR